MSPLYFPSRVTKVLAISSGGNYWSQMLRLRPAFKGTRVLFASVGEQNGGVAPCPFVSIPDANGEQKFRLLLLMLRLFWIFVCFRPDVVITTGAIPGYFAIRLGRLFGARSMFLDSIANAEKLSLAAQLAKKHSDAVLTQWPHLTNDGSVRYSGTVL